MNEHLKLLNGFVGFANRLAGWPDFLSKEGYILYWVGPSYMLSDGRKVNPDLLFVSARLNHSLIVECKSGVTADAAQLQTLRATTKDDLIHKAQVTFQAPHTATFDIAIGCYSQHSTALTKTLDKAGLVFPLLVIDCSAGQVSLRDGVLNSKPISALLEKGVELDSDYWPVQFIPYDETSDDAEIAACIIPNIVSTMRSGAPHLDVTDILRDTCPVSDRLHPTEETQIARRVRSVLRSAASGEFRGLLRPIGGGRYHDKWLVSDSIKTGGIPKRVGPRSLNKRTSDFISRLRKGTEFVGYEDEEETWQYPMDLGTEQ